MAGKEAIEKIDIQDDILLYNSKFNQEVCDSTNLAHVASEKINCNDGA